MSIQILGIRLVKDPRTGKLSKRERFYDRQWRAGSVRELFDNLNEHISKIPEEERFNIYYTPAHCFEMRGRKFERSTVIPFDIDGIDRERAQDVARVAVKALGLDWGSTAAVFSGNGVQLLVETVHEFTDPDFFESHRTHYRALLDRIGAALSAAGLKGEPDAAVFHRTALMRLPGTENRKPGKSNILAAFLQPNLRPVDFDIAQRSGVPSVAATDAVTDAVLKRYPTPDSETIQAECKFLTWAREAPGDVTEPLWYASASILGRLPDGERLFHEYSKGHPGYNEHETDEKLKQALEASGPRTCKNINDMWGKCQGCKHFGTTLASPILIRGENFIKTQGTGFHEVKLDTNGNPKPGKPAYEDLRRYFEMQNAYVSTEAELVYTWTGTYWKECPDAVLKHFAQEHFMPKADTRMRTEFKNLVCVTNPVSSAWFDESTERKMNFSNGVLDIDTMRLEPHDKDFGFRHVLPYDYDPAAKCPRFEKFLDEVTFGDSDLQKVLMEFAGYSFSNDECWEQKALVMSGEGSNGKSTFMDVLRALAGRDNYTSLNLADLRNDANRYQLVGKLFNLSEETPTHSLVDSSLFKNLVSGGETIVKMLYKQPFTVSNRTKLILSCNELPKSKDTTHALFRRLLIVPFNRKFEGASRDRDIKTKLLSELPGIFNLVIEGYKRLRRQKGFTESATIRGEVRAYRESVDPVVTWFNDYVVVESTASAHFATSKRLYDSYKYIVEGRGEKPLTYDMFCKRIKQQLPDADGRYRYFKVEGKTTRGYMGLKLMDESEI